MKFVFNDGEQIGVYDNGKTGLFVSNYIVNYKDAMLKSQKNKEWKKKSTELYDNYGFLEQDEGDVQAKITSVALSGEANKIVYAYEANFTHGIYLKQLDDELKTEAHIVSSDENSFDGLFTLSSGRMLCGVRPDTVTENIAVFDKNGDYKTITDGDSLDENPSYEESENAIYFNSYGVGRDASNAFVKYLPSEIYRLNLHTMDIDEVLSDARYSFVKPKKRADGLYFIRTPAFEREGNPLLEILLIPVRLVQAIAGFISSFVMCFAGKPLVEGQSSKDISNKDKRKIFINHNLINVDKQLKKNKKTTDYGFIPLDYKLMKIENGKDTVLFSGVADYCFSDDGTLIFTNGKHIFSYANGVKTKLVDTDFCVHLGGIEKTGSDDGFFGL